MGTAEAEHSVNFNIRLPSARHAEIAANTLSVDKEPRRSGVGKTITHTGSELNIVLQAREARLLRVSSNSILEHLQLVIETMEKFGPPLE